MSPETTTNNIEASDQKEAPLVEGNLWLTIWTMSWPLVLQTLCSSIVGLVDIQVAKTLGYETQAAVGLAEQVLFIFMIFLMSSAVGTTAMASRAFGEKDSQRAMTVIGHSLVLAGSLGILLTLLCLAGAPYVMRLFSPAEPVAILAAGYLRIYSFFLISFGIICAIAAAFRASGDSKTPLLIILTSTIIAITGDIATIYYGFPVAGLGIRGIAYSGLAGNLTAAIVALLCLRRSKMKESFRHLAPIHPDVMRRLVEISLPSGFTRLGWSSSTFCVFFILSHCPAPTAAIASWTIGMRCESFLFMPMVALSMAISSIVGQNLGAHKLDRAYAAGWRVTWAGTAMLFILGALLFMFAGDIAVAMTTDLTSIEYVRSYLRISALAEPMIAISSVISGALQGAGDTKTPMWIMIFAHYVFRLPVAWWLALHSHMGPTGVWIAMNISLYVMAALSIWRFRSKAWAKVKV